MNIPSKLSELMAGWGQQDATNAYTLWAKQGGADYDAEGFRDFLKALHESNIDLLNVMARHAGPGLPWPEVVQLHQELVNNGMIYRLGKDYQEMAESLQNEGMLTGFVKQTAGNPFHIETNQEEGYVRIARHSREILHWSESEWTTDPDVVYAITNAINLALTNPQQMDVKLRKMGKLA